MTRGTHCHGDFCALAPQLVKATQDRQRQNQREEEERRSLEAKQAEEARRKTEEAAAANKGGKGYINFSMLVDSITEITTPAGDMVSDKKQITEFCDNCDAKVINEIQDELVKIRLQAQIKPLQLKATEEQIKKGAPTSYEVPVTFDNSNFFE